MMIIDLARTAVLKPIAREPPHETHPMTQSAAERAEVSRRNGRLGRGPRTDEGRRRAGEAARDRSLRAGTIALTHEDRDAIAARADLWHDAIRPDSPMACHLVNECARASVLADRADQFLQATIEDHVEQAHKLF